MLYTATKYNDNTEIFILVVTRPKFYLGHSKKGGFSSPKTEKYDERRFFFINFFTCRLKCIG